MKKRGVILIAIIAVAIVLAVVFVNLFKDRTTVSLATSVNNYVASGYLSSENENYEKISGYCTDLTAELGTGHETELEEVTNFTTLYSAYQDLGAFYNRVLYFTDYNTTYSKNQKSARDNLSKASGYVQDICDYIDEHSSATGDWLIRSWSDVREYVTKFISANNTAFSKIQTIYAACGSGVINNDFSKLVLSTVNSYLSDAEENFSTSTEDAEEVIILTTSYLDASYTGLENYYLNEALQQNVNAISADGVLKENIETEYASILTAFLAGEF